MLSVFNIFNSIMSLGKDHFAFPNEDVYIYIFGFFFFFLVHRIIVSCTYIRLVKR